MDSRRALRRTLIGLGAAAAMAGLGYLATRAVARRIRALPDPFAGEEDSPPEDARHEWIPTYDGGEIHAIVRSRAGNGGGEGSAAVASGASAAIDTAEWRQCHETRPLVLLHGIGLRAGIWRYQFLDLTDRFQVIAADTRGHGGSRIGSEGYGLAPSARDVATLLEHLDLRRAIVVGHSMGGMVLMRFATDHRTVLDERVAGLVFLATSPHLGVPTAISARAEVWAERAAGWEGHRLRIPLDRLARSDLSYVLARVAFGTDPKPSHVELTRRMLSEVPLQAFVPSGLQLLTHDASEALAETDTPSLVVVGSEDHLTPPRFSEALARSLPQSRLVVMPGAGHQLMLERREELADLLRSFDAELAAENAD
jgi:pimeloyl-ACP methyl ester carboxylesterase